LSDFYSAITSAIGTLKGPLHGGANEGVIQMLEEIGSEDKVDAYIEKKLANKEKIMGIGHRVYKTLDPRAPHLQRMAVKLSEKLGDPKWINMSERIAPVNEGKEEPERECRFLFRDSLLFVRHPDRLVHSCLRHCPLRRLVRTRSRAARGQSPLPSAERIYWGTSGQKGRTDRSTSLAVGTIRGVAAFLSGAASTLIECCYPEWVAMTRWLRRVTSRKRGCICGTTAACLRIAET
jgi:hypothetical protein